METHTDDLTKIWETGWTEIKDLDLDTGLEITEIEIINVTVIPEDNLIHSLSLKKHLGQSQFKILKLAWPWISCP